MEEQVRDICATNCARCHIDTRFRLDARGSVVRLFIDEKKYSELIIGKDKYASLRLKSSLLPILYDARLLDEIVLRLLFAIRIQGIELNFYCELA